MPTESPKQFRLGGWLFHPVRLPDRERFAGYIRQTEYQADLWSSNFAYIWATSRPGSQKLWKIVDGMLVPFMYTRKGSLYLYCLPFGPGDPAKVTRVVRRCLSHCYAFNRQNAGRTLVRMINQGQLDFLHRCPEFDRNFRAVPWEGVERHFDVAKLSALKGSEFSNIRNRVRKFARDHPDSGLTPYRDADFETLMELGRQWQAASGSKYPTIFDGHYYRELVAHGKILGQTTLVMRVGGRTVGMVAGSPLPTGDSWGSIVKFEPGYPGLSETLIVEFARYLHRLDPRIRRINVGSDLGRGGLRDYKLKFRPVLSYRRYQIYFRPSALPAAEEIRRVR